MANRAKKEGRTLRDSKNYQKQRLKVANYIDTPRHKEKHSNSLKQNHDPKPRYGICRRLTGKKHA